MFKSILLMVLGGLVTLMILSILDESDLVVMDDCNQYTSECIDMDTYYLDTDY